MNTLIKQQELINWETSTHYCIINYFSGLNKVTNVRWVRKDKYIKK